MINVNEVNEHASPTSEDEKRFYGRFLAFNRALSPPPCKKS